MIKNHFIGHREKIIFHIMCYLHRDVLIYVHFINLSNGFWVKSVKCFLIDLKFNQLYVFLHVGNTEIPKPPRNG